MPITIDPASLSAFHAISGAVKAYALEGHATKIMVLDCAAGVKIRRDRLHHGVSAHDRAAVSIVLGGACTVAHDQSETVAPAGCVVITDLAGDFCLRVPDDGYASLATVIVGRHRLGNAALNRIGRRPMVMAGNAPVVAALSGFVRTFVEQSASSGGRPVTPPDIDLFGEALAAMLPPVILQQPRAAASVHPARRNDLDAICRFIDMHLLSSELSPELVAGEFGMSRAVLFRVFKPMGGVATYIRRQRLGWAAARFAEDGASPRSIAVIARQLNFTSVPAFARAYKEHHGSSPARLRSRAGALPPA